ncbi:MAG: AAA family ATPase [Actinomycetota bacterium]
MSRIENEWREAPIVWLTGVRRVGKTTLAQSLGDKAQYVNCDLPVVTDMTSDPELFYKNAERPVIIFDEIHQLPDPSKLLKIGADVFPDIKILATGSSTLAASYRFKDTLTGRKRTVHLTPVLYDEIDAFDATLAKRLFHGGLPQALLAKKKDPGFYREWMDSFFARDVQKLFSFRDVQKFNSVLEYLLKQSGGMFEITRTARALGISRPTIENHLRALEITNAVTLVRPFHSGGKRELLRMPKVYGFDTGFVSFARGWDPLRPEDNGKLWEHVVLEYLQTNAPDTVVGYWRDKDEHGVDFVMPRKRNTIDAVECKWDPKDFSAAGIKAFRSRYPRGNNYVISPISGNGYAKKVFGIEVYICSPPGWRKSIG